MDNTSTCSILSIHKDYDNIILDYFKYFISIKRSDIDYLINQSKNNYDYHHVKIVHNKLYICNKEKYMKWENRFESMKHLLLNVLKNYKLDDCEFVLYTGDAINLSEVDRCSIDGRILPLIVSTSVLDSINMLLCPDFTFSFAPCYRIKNNSEMCNKVVEYQNNYDFEDKINKIIWRGSGNNAYRKSYLRYDEKYDILSNLSNETTNYISYLDKSKYKYQLYLNGHQGNQFDGAYSSSFKWSLMSKQVVFYSAPSKYREFWNHESIFKEGIHYIYSKNPSELDSKFNHILNDTTISKTIANNAFTFFKKYLLDFNNIIYYMYSLLNQYSTRLEFKVILVGNEELIDTLLPNSDIDSNI